MSKQISTIVILVIGFAFAGIATAKEIVVKRYHSTNNAAQNTAMSDGPTTIQQN